MNRNLTVLAVIVVGLLIVLSQTFFIVDQRTQAVIVRLGFQSYSASIVSRRWSDSWSW